MGMAVDTKTKHASAQMPSKTFAEAMGQAVWLMTMSKAHRDLPIRELERRVALPILLKQFRTFVKDNQPVAFLTWGAVSDAVRRRLASGDKEMAETDWRSGPNLMVVDVISPFNSPEVFRQKFESSLISGEST